MTNPEAPVTWRDYQKHLDETMQGYQRLALLEAEIKGDATTGRLSLRMDMASLIENLTDRFISEQRKTRISVIVAVLVAVVGMIAQHFLLIAKMKL